MLNNKGFSIFSKFLLVVVFSLLFMTCDPGLGKAVDTQAPKVEIQYPVTKSVLKGAFTMKGIASDEVKVASCTVTFKNIKTSNEYKFTAKVENDEFKVSLNTPKTDGTYELPDGDYNVTVTVSDAYRKSTADIVYTIDNTSPTVLITSPNAYVESNWPDMYKSISIKGEVYDATTISQVKVYIIDKNGKQIYECIADGTNTFNASIKDPELSDGGEYFYYVVATDAGGNENTYCYHKYDIFNLLSSIVQKNKTVTEENTIIFPSINTIGYIDQGLETLLENISDEELAKRKIPNKKENDGNAILTKGQYPGFNYYQKDTAKVKWLNISEDGTAGIGIGSPVLGTIMPSTDGSAIINDTVKVYLQKQGDSGIFEAFPEEDTTWADGNTKWILDASTKKSGETGETQVKLTQVGESLNFQIDSHPVGEDENNWDSGKYKVKICFSTTTITTSSDCEFYVESGAPKITEENLSKDNPYASYYRGYMTAQTKEDGKNYLIGQVKTSDGASLLPLTYSYLKSGELDGQTGTIETSSMIDEKYSIEIPINSETHENDGEYTYTLESKTANLSTVISRVVVVDTTNPVIVFNGLENEKVLDELNFVVKANIEDTNGIEKVEYQLFVDETQILADGSLVSSLDATEWTEISGSKTSIELSLTNLQKEKTYKIKIRAKDVAGNVNGEDEFTRTFTVDNTVPAITTSLSPVIMYDNDEDGETEETVNGTISITVKALDDHSLKSVYYTTKTSSDLSDEADWSGEFSFTQEELSKGKTISIDTTQFTNKEKLSFRIKAIDSAGNVKIDIVSPIVNQDSDRPNIVPSNFEVLQNKENACWNLDGAKNIFGSSNPNMIFTVSDDDTVKEYHVKINDGEFTKVTDVNSSQKIMSYSVENLSYGRHSITFKIFDSNYIDDLNSPNNFITQVYYIAIDDGFPELNIQNGNGEFVGSSFEIKGTVSDENGINNIILQSVSGVQYKVLTIGDGLVEKSDATNTYEFSYNFVIPDVKETIQIIATDSLGATSLKEISYLIDKTAPELVVSEDISPYVNIDYPTLRISGSATDGDLGIEDNGISGIDQVRLKIGSSITGIDDVDSTLASGKIENGILYWATPLDFTEKAAGDYTVYIQAFDVAGNAAEEQSITVYLDTDVPIISHDYAESYVGVFNTDFIISGTVSDAIGVKSVSAKIQGVNGNLDSVYDSFDGENWAFSVPASIGDGQLTIIITAIDGCGKSEQGEFTATLDTVAPSVSFTDISNDDNSNATIETSKTTDKPRISVTYSDSTSGVNKVDYTFYYYDAEQGKFVDYSSIDANAKGTFTRDKSFSGTVVMRMAESTGSTGAFIGTDTLTDGIWYVEVIATDAAGNTLKDESPHFYVDQHKPELNVTSPAENVSLKKQGDSLRITGTTSDSYGGEIDRVEISVKHPSYTASQSEQFTKTFDVNATDYAFDFEFVESPFIYPDVYEIFVTSYDKAGNQKDYTKRISCDNTAPTITFARPYSYSVDSDGNESVGNVVNSPIGDTNIKATANDYSMDSIYYQIGGTVEINEKEGTLGTPGYKIKKLTITGGALSSDNYGNSVNNPSSDNLAAGIVNGTWNKLKDANLDFDVTYNTLTLVNGGYSYHATADKETIQTLDVHIVTVDTAGNVNYCKFPLKVDTDTDKPTLLLLSPKTIGDVANVGGTATISGTVNDDNAVHSVWMQVELVNGNYVDNILTGKNDTFGVDYTSYGITNPQNITDAKSNSNAQDNAYFKDKTQWYKVNIGEQGKSTTWNMVLNKNKEFDNENLFNDGYLKSEVEQTELIVRVKALDTKSGDSTVSADAKEGDVTEFTLKIDSGSPSIIVNNIADFKEEGSYIGGNLTFDISFTDDEAITEWKIEAVSTLNGDNRSMEIASNDYVKANVSYEVGLGSSVGEIITVDTAKIYTQCGNLIQIRITAKDNSKDASGQTEQPKESSITFKYTIDNTSPHANYVSTIDSVKYYLDTEAVGSGANRETNARGNHLRIISEQAALKGNVLDETNGSGVDFVMLYFTKEISGTTYLYNPSKRDTRSVISTTYNIEGEDKIFPVENLSDIVRTAKIDGSTPYIIVDRAEGWDDDGANGDFDGYSENLKANGEWVVYFNSTNLPDSVYDVHYVVVDYAGNARYYSDTMLVQNNPPKITGIVLATDIDGDGTATISIDGTTDEDDLFDSSSYIDSKFTVRNSKLKVGINSIGGTGTKKYYLTYPTETGNVTINNTTGIFEITSFPLDEEQVANYEVPKYVVWVEDSVEENLSLSSGETTIEMIMDNNDSVSPVAQLFELNTIVEDSATSNEDRGSLYKEGSSVQGHIEPRDYSRFGNDSKNDPDVSGKIILRGEVMDNQRIGSIKLILKDDEIEIAKWNDSTDALEPQNNASITSTLGLKGHHVEWSYVWDTNGFAAKDVDVAVMIVDASGNSSEESIYSTTDNIPHSEENMFSSNDWGYNSMTVDVVPYITAVENNISKTAGAEFARSALGNYVIYAGESFTINGFNLEGTSATVKLGDEILSITSGNSNSLTVKSTTSSVTSEVEIVSNGITSINNINENPEFDDMGNIIGGASYNSQANNKTNNRLNDDCKIYVWDMGFFVNQTDLTSPIMKMDSSGRYYMSYGHGVPRMYLNNNGTIRQVDYSYNKFHNTMVGFDSSGNIYGLATNTDRVNNSSAKFVFYTEAPSDITSSSSEYQSTSIYKRHLEQVYNYKTGVYDINRVKTPKMFITGAGTSDNPAKVAISYFDANNTISPVKFRYGTVADITTITGGIQGNTASSSGSGAGESNNPNTTDSSASGYHIVASNNTTYKGGAYSAVGLTSGGVAVVAWYDASSKSLIYSYNTNPNTPVVGGAWQANAKVIDDSYAGWYVDMTVDENDGIHIAYYNIGKGDLKYAYLAKYNATPQVVTVESYLSTGTNITINTRKEGSSIVPYISYYHAASAQTPNAVRLAWRKDFSSLTDGVIDDKFTGSWEVMTVPASNIPIDAQICNGVPTSGTYGDTVVLGYMSDQGYEKAYIKY